jgi:hypothetical protein
MPSLTQLRYQLSEGFFSFVALAAEPEAVAGDEASTNEPASSGADGAAGVTHTHGSKVPDAVQTCAPLAPVVQVHGELAPVTHGCCRLHALAPKQKNKTNDAIVCRFVAFMIPSLVSPTANSSMITRFRTTEPRQVRGQRTWPRPG